ncbi:hypothetical protein N6H18_07120 [Reichenbachiella agarivorans]|uniref:Small multi-drug export protein n=1 Tax=Reichenbachiella agarivorans TaxID=2979464 RepID=A0ABY6CT75_9BACT|nr:hypothetical protein [Reichenbachiella agarivorans]UXP33722.1 hypothetical protein N6H18_07120 [Reichenbachiella agarivorans]
MVTEILKYLSIYLGSMLKIMVGPVLGLTYDYNIFITGTLTALGMMTSVYLITFFGANIRHYSQAILNRKRKNIFSKKTRQYVRIWQKYGVPGIAFLTPVLFMPIGGAIIANAFGGKKADIFKYMWISSLFWSYFLAWLVRFAGDLLPFLGLTGGV